MICIPSLDNNSITNAAEAYDKRSYEEWVKSSVNDLIISLNFRTIHDASEVDKLLNRNSNTRWKHSNHLVPCWTAIGIDPLTEEPSLLGVQVKPDIPSINKQGKAEKYIGATDYGSCPLFLSTGIDNFWKAVIADKSKPIILTEGAKKAGCGLSNEYITISIPGVSTCRKNGRLHDSLKLFTGFGRTFYLCFDNDIMHKKPVQNALLGMARELSASGSKVMVIELPPGELKGMDDFISNNGKEEFDKLIDNALTIEEWRKKLDELWIQQQLEEGEETKCKLKRQFDIVRQGWGEGLRINQMVNQIELAGDQLDLDQIRLRMALEFGEAVPIGDAQAIVQMLAGQNAYHPVNDYLETLGARYPDIDVNILDNLATRYFGTDNELYNIYMKKTLLAAVARIKQPGCRVESVPILVNPRQGIGKSTFWRNLFGEEWFSDDMGDANEKDERMKLHQFWCLEWSEFETVYKKKDVSALKKFITTKTDSYRTPYSRTVKAYPRRSVLVGTTNEQEILADPTGSRRFWVIPVKGMIPVEQVAAERDFLWAAAYALYKSGEKWNLTSAQEELVEELNKHFQVVDPWLEKIQEYVEYKDLVTMPELFKLLDIETSRQDVGFSKRIGAVMSRLGWESERVRLGGAWVRKWTKKNQKDGVAHNTESIDTSCVLSMKKNQKVEKVTGSTGSAFDSAIQSTKIFNTTYESVKNENKPDVRVSENTYQQNDVIYGISPTDVTSPELQPIKLQPDPVDPVTFPTFQNNQNGGCDPSESKENCKLNLSTIQKQKIDYQFWLIDPTTISFTIPSQFGDIICTAEPTATILNRARMKSGYVCQITWHWPTGTKASVGDVPIEAQTGKKDFEELAQRIAKEWIDEQLAATLLPAFQISVDGPLGCSTVDITPLRMRKDNRIQYRLAYKFADYTIHKEERPAEGNAGAEAIARERIASWQNVAIAKSQFKRGDLVEIVSDRKLKGPFVVDIVDCNGVLVSQPKLKNGFSKPIGTFQSAQLRKLD